jgi:hypothetical protein
MFDAINQLTLWIFENAIGVAFVGGLCWLIVLLPYKWMMFEKSNYAKGFTTGLTFFLATAFGCWVYTQDIRMIGGLGHLFLLVVLPITIGWIINWAVDMIAGLRK